MAICNDSSDSHMDRDYLHGELPYVQTLMQQHPLKHRILLRFIKDPYIPYQYGHDIPICCRVRLLLLLLPQITNSFPLVHLFTFDTFSIDKIGA